MSALAKPDPAKPQRPLNLILIDDDPIFRAGLRLVAGQFPDLQVVAEAPSCGDAWQILANAPPVDLAILDLGLGSSTPSEMTGLELCQQLKTQYPHLSVLLLSSLKEPVLLAAARQMGVEGYCPKGIAVSELVDVIRLVGAGESYWHPQLGSGEVTPPLPSPRSKTQGGLLPSLLNNIRLSGLRQIEAALNDVTAQLESSKLSLLDRAILAGHQRELKAARTLVKKLLGEPAMVLAEPQISLTQSSARPSGNRDRTYNTQHSALSTVPLPKRSPLFEATFAKIEYGLQNLTNVPLEIDIFREEKKRELLCLVLQKLENLLDDLRFSQVQPSQLQKKRSAILEDLWQATATDFFGKYSTLEVGDKQLEIASVILQDRKLVNAEILDKIPQVVDLFSYLLFETPLIIDNLSYPAETAEAIARAELLLQNLAIQVANGVVQPLLNNFADVETIKQNFYDSRLISSRDIERFRNDLSWKYRLERYLEDPKAIFESRYILFFFNGVGIKKVSVYSPRREELAELTGIGLGVTIALELRDAIAPRLRTLVAFVGNGVVYLLTQVLGRGIGLIGRGILEGIGNSFDESRMGRNNERK